MNDGIRSLIYRAIDSQSALLPAPLDISRGDDTNLFGEGGQLDSMSLVSLIVGIEEEVESQFGVSLILASDKAMSMRRSPFATVGSLLQYVESLMTEKEDV
ncbi:MAG TPA: hypothetical protein VI653_22915 [Steroidobacteraceae bacterium]